MKEYILKNKNEEIIRFQVNSFIDEKTLQQIKEIKIFGIDLLSYTLFLWEKGKGVYDKACGHICPYLNKDMNVLELVCDSGQLSFRLSKHVKRWIGTVFSEWMILEAKKA